MIALRVFNACFALRSLFEKDLRFTHDFIKTRFQDGREVDAMIRDLRSGVLDAMRSDCFILRVARLSW